MKKCTEKKCLYIYRISKNRFRRKQRKKRRKHSNRTSQASVGQKYILLAPKVFSLTEKKHRNELLDFIKRLNREVHCQNGEITINFFRTEQMVAEGVLLFRAHLCRLLRTEGLQARIKCHVRPGTTIAQVLSQVGIFELLNQSDQEVVPDHEDVMYWRYAQGSGAVGEKYEEILGGYDGTITQSLQSGLYVGLTEAMTNTRSHAYPDQDIASTDFNEWWMFSQEKDNRLYVCFCDLGVGIPGSLPKNKKQKGLWSKVVARYGLAVKDSVVIKEAIKHSHTRTGEEHRGKGLKQLTGVLNHIDGGDLILHSNSGCYRNIDGIIDNFDYESSIGGTLISWSLPV